MTTTATGSSTDLAYRELKNWILLGEIPLGMRLSEERIGERLSLSRTPVREALLRLHAERFVERRTDGGYRINHPTARSMEELYELRKALELYAVRHTVAEPGEAAAAILEQLHADWAALERDAPESDPDFVILDEDFHQRLAQAAGNGELVAALRRVCERIRPVRTHDFITPGRIDATIWQHLEILEAVLARHVDSDELLERHISESKSFVERAVGRALERMLTTDEASLGW
jgi:DNA-binding GntR family transcriptional regulator